VPESVTTCCGIRAGHDVFFGSRDRGKARAAGEASGNVASRFGSLDDAAAFGEVLLYTVRDVLPSALLQAPEALKGKVVIDCTNSPILGFEVPDPQKRPGIHFETPAPSRAERLAADSPGARVVKAFNMIPQTVIDLGAAKLRETRPSVFICGDDGDAKSMVMRLAEDLGFAGVDSGALEHARLVEGAADFLRFQIVSGLAPYATLAISVLSPP
jgi:predicted dinucleotide-binding enzyme